MTTFDEWLLRKPFTQQLRRELDSPGAEIELTSEPSLRIRHLAYRTVSATAEAVARDADSSRHMLHTLELHQEAAVLRLAASADAVIATDDTWRATTEALRQAREALAVDAQALFASIWFDDYALDIFRWRAGVTSDIGFFDACLPENGRLVGLLPTALRGAKRPAPSLAVNPPWPCSTFAAAHRTRAQRPPASVVEQARAVLRMSERLSQCWPLFVCAISIAVQRLTGWQEHWPVEIVRALETA
jgi:hypothetical protein